MMDEKEAIATIRRIKKKSKNTDKELEELILAIRFLSRSYPQFQKVADEADDVKHVDILDLVLERIDEDGE